MSQRDKDISFIKAHLGDSFKEGRKIVQKGNNRYAVVVLQDDREVKVSLPNVDVCPYKTEPIKERDD